MKIPLIKQNIRQATVIIAFVAIVSQVLGLIREMIVANYLGTSAEYDILLISIAIPMMAGTILFMTIPSAGIPSLQEKIGGLHDGDKNLKISFVKVNTIITLCISLVLFLLFPLLSRILGAGMSEASIQTISLFGRISCLIIPFRAYDAMFRCFLHIDRSFLFPAVSTLGFNLMIILLLVTFFPALGSPVYIPAWIAGICTQMLIVAIPALMLSRREGGKRTETNFSASSYTVFFLIIVLIESISQVVAPFDRYLAGNLLASGYVSANTYAGVLSGAPIRVFIYAIATAIFPSLSEEAVHDDRSKFTQLYHRSLTVSTLIILPVVYYMYIFDREIVSLVFERGRFGTESTLMTTEVFKYYLIAMVFTAMFTIQMKVSYALKTWRPLIAVRILSAVPKILLGVFLIIDDWALALGGGTAVMYGVSFVLLEAHFIVKENLKYDGVEIIALMKAVFCAFVCMVMMAALNHVLEKIIRTDPIVNLAAVGIAGLAVLLVMASGLKVLILSKKT